VYENLGETNGITVFKKKKKIWSTPNLQGTPLAQPWLTGIKDGKPNLLIGPKTDIFYYLRGLRTVSNLKGKVGSVRIS